MPCDFSFVVLPILYSPVLVRTPQVWVLREGLQNTLRHTLHLLFLITLLLHAMKPCAAYAFIFVAREIIGWYQYNLEIRALDNFIELFEPWYRIKPFQNRLRHVVKQT